MGNGGKGRDGKRLGMCVKRFLEMWETDTRAPVWNRDMVKRHWEGLLCGRVEFVGKWRDRDDHAIKARLKLNLG